MKKVFVIEGSLKKRQEILKKIRESLGSFDEYVITSKNNINEVIHQITQSGCFSDQLFIIEELPSLSNSKSKSTDRSKVLSIFEDVIPNVPYGNTVVFNNLNINSKGFIKIVEKNGEVLKFQQKVSVSDATNFLTSYYSKKNVEIEYETAKTLPEALIEPFAKEIDADVFRIMVKKLDMYIGGRKSIKKDDILIICKDMSESYLIWTLYDYLDKKDFEGALRFCRVYLYRDSQISYGDFLKTLYTISARYRLLLFLRNTIIDQGITKKEEIINIVRELKKISFQGKDTNMCIKVSDKGYEEAFSEKMIYKILSGGNNSVLSRYTTEQLNLIIYAISKASMKLRVGCTQSEIDIAFEFILMTICGKVKKRETLDVLNFSKKYKVDRKW